MSGGPYTFFSRPIIIKHWSSDFDLYEEVLRVIPLWIRLPNLPLNCWSCDSLSRIGSLLGVPVCADDCTTKQQRVSFARLLVEMDVTGELREHIWIEDISGNVFKQKVQYDWRPTYCHQCQMPGHNCEAVNYTHHQPTRKETQKVKKVWVPKKQQPVVAGAPTPASTPLNQPVAVTHSGADAGWRVATKSTRNRGVPVPTSNTFCTLVEDDSDTPNTDDDIDGDTAVGQGDGIVLPPDPLC
ncbi:uncharacterized protein [Spinacia oleracea]|uniref:DUF4283 domain-containing protein n=1 Tax=Spinacia oleracea TaxID=3562 RepID=A0ABM3QRL0_SPIOL|nr:uncharacterized protein LOC130461796 [Spinacia oleracea]